MFTLNLLSEKQKKIIRFELYNRSAMRLGITLVFILAVFSILLIPTFIFLAFQRGDLERDLEVEQQNQENSRVKEVEVLIAGNNGIIESLARIDSGAKKISPIVSIVYGLSTKNVTITEFKYSRPNNEIIIKGNADHIKDFLIFKDALSGLPHFSEIISPPENVSKLKDLSFLLRAKLKS